VEALTAAEPEVLEPRFRADLREASDTAGRLRVVVDQVASLTDASALEWHARLC
jgi:dGTPase